MRLTPRLTHVVCETSEPRPSIPDCAGWLALLTKKGSTLSPGLHLRETAAGAGACPLLDRGELEAVARQMRVLARCAFSTEWSLWRDDQSKTQRATLELSYLPASVSEQAANNTGTRMCNNIPSESRISLQSLARDVHIPMFAPVLPRHQ